MNFKGTYRCEYATTEQLSIEQIKKELEEAKDENKLQQIQEQESNN